MKDPLAPTLTACENRVQAHHDGYECVYVACCGFCGWTSTNAHETRFEARLEAKAHEEAK